LRHISKYRRNITASLKNLTYLDDRPVYDYERLFVNAWVEGGEEAEKKAQEEYAYKKKKEQIDFIEFGIKHGEEGKKKRKEFFKKMIEETK